MQDATYPFFGIQIQILNLSVLEEAREANPVVCHVSLLSKHRDIVFSRSGIVFEDFLTETRKSVFRFQLHSIAWLSLLT
jgi:hypothetical protein